MYPMMPLIDFVIPTQFKPERMIGLAHQIRSAIWQYQGVRVVILATQENIDRYAGELFLKLSDAEQDATKLFAAPDGFRGNPQHEPRGYMNYVPMLKYMESDDVAEFQMHGGDDDSLTPWAFKALMDTMPGQSMVVGRAIAVSRAGEDKRDWHLGTELERCHVNLTSVLLRTASVRALQRPWLDVTTGYGDWLLIERMAQNFPYKLIPTIISVTSMTL